MRSADPRAAAAAFVAAGTRPRRPRRGRPCAARQGLRGDRCAGCHRGRAGRRRRDRAQLRARHAPRADARRGGRAGAAGACRGIRRSSRGRRRDGGPAGGAAARGRRRRRPRCRPAQRGRAAVGPRRRRPPRVEGAPRPSRRRPGQGRPRGTRLPGSRRHRASCSTPPAARTPAARGSASTRRSRARSPARCRSRWPAASTRRTSARRCWRCPRRASTPRPAPSTRDAPASGRARTRVRVALLVKRARDARRHRPNTPSRPSPVHEGLLEADAAGRWGKERDFGGRYVPETLMAALQQLEAAYAALRHDPRFWAELDGLLARFAGRPTPLYRADRLAAAVEAEAARLAASASRRTTPVPSLRLYLKREDLAHTGAHKINNALGQALLTRRLGKSRVIAETGAGQHGVATATACALLGLPCVVFMGEEDIRRQAPNVLRMRALGAEVRSVTSGTATLKDAVNEAMRDWVTNVETTHYVLGSAMGPHPYPTIVRDLQRRIGDEAAAQLRAVEGRLPDLALACVGGGSNAIGLLSAVHRRARRPARGRGGRGRRDRDGPPRRGHRRRHAGHPPRLAEPDAPGPRRPGRRGAQRERRPGLPGRRPPARGPRGGRPARGRDRHRPRGRRRDEGRDPDRGDPPRARDLARRRGAAQAPRRARGLRDRHIPPRPSSCSASPAAATRTSRRSSASPTSSRGRPRDDHRRAARVLPLAAGRAREGDLGRRRARRGRHVPGEGQDLRDHGARRAAARASAPRSTSRPSSSTRFPACSARRPTSAGSAG